MATYAQDTIDRLNREAPDQDPDLIRLYALLVLVKGEDTTLEDVHDAWALWRLSTRPDHPDLVPFDQLTSEVQEYDQPYRDAIARTATLKEA